jgi:hypothetical protein
MPLKPDIKTLQVYALHIENHRDKRERERAKHRSLLLNTPHGLQSDSDVKVRVSFQNESDSVSPLYTHPYADTSCHSFIRERVQACHINPEPHLHSSMIKAAARISQALIETRLLAACSGSSAASASPHPLYAKPSPCKQRAAKGVSKSSVSCSARSGEAQQSKTTWHTMAHSILLRT